MMTGMRVATEFERLVNRLVNAAIKAPEFWLIEVANCSISVPTIEINCGAMAIIAGNMAFETDEMIVRILGN